MNGYYSSTDYVRRFAEALKADPSAHRVGCSAWERRTGSSLGLAPETLLALCAEVDEMQALVNDIEIMATKSNKMPEDFQKRISEGMKLHHRRRKIVKAEREVIEAVMRQWAMRDFRDGFMLHVKDACQALEQVRGS